MQTAAICKMQEIIALAKAGKSPRRVMSHKEFVKAMKGEESASYKYDQVNDKQRQRWLDIVNKSKKTR